jgi:hypothetical protein
MASYISSSNYSSLISTGCELLDTEAPPYCVFPYIVGRWYWDILELSLLAARTSWYVKNRTSTLVQRCGRSTVYVSAVVTGNGKLRSYLYKFKIIDDPTCPCQMVPQSTEHLTRECTILNKQRDTLKNGITNAGGRWPLLNSELANKDTNLFQTFVNSVNFKDLWRHKMHQNNQSN